MKKAILWGIVLAAAVCLGGSIPAEAQELPKEKRISVEAETEIAVEMAASMENQAAGETAAERDNSPDTVYQKLKKGKEVRVAVLGDSIGSGTGTDPEHSWDALLADWLWSEYGGEVTLDNYAVGGTGSFTGYCQSEGAMREKADYDLVFICYGQNDDTDDFYLIYESMLRSVKKYNPSCQIITVLESSQQIYTGKMHAIIRLSYLYGADVADMLRDFILSGIPYGQLCSDGVHPNTEGHKLYFESIRSIIEKNVELGKEIAPMPEPSEDTVRLFENYAYIPLEKCAYADGEYRFVTDRPVLGLAYRHSGRSGDIVLKFDTGGCWEGTGKTDIQKEWTEAVLIDTGLTPGTLISLPDPRGDIDETVEGFIIAGM